jgi:type VI secretion system secreted protein VgrG
MSSFTIATQPFTLQIKGLDAYKVFVRSFTGEEGISKLFRFRLQVDIYPAASYPAASATQLLGQEAVLKVELQPGKVRKFLATICSVEEAGADEHDCACYELELVPRLWPLYQTVRSRVFEDVKPLDIIAKVLTGSGVKVLADSSAEDRTRPYCVQYFESDFDFVVRLLEEEGYIYLYGGDEKDEPTFAIKRIPFSFPDPLSLTFDERGGGHEERIGSWRKTRSVTATAMTGRDHFFQAPSPVLQGVASVPASTPAIPGWEALNATWPASVDRYPGQWAHLFEGVSMARAVSTPTGYIEFGGTRMWHELRQAAGSSSLNAGASNCPRLAAGTVFELVNHPVSGGKHVVVSVRHKAAQALQHSSHHDHGFEYENEFTCVPYSETMMMYLPPRSTRKPVIHGCQTAIVVGASGSDEIWTDKYGRVQVQFWWDRGSTRSCWIRVATSWAGSGWGIQHVPRVGQEVVVTFLDGDPDRPLIVGSVYNPGHMPPFGLPQNQTQSGIRTHSTPGGGPGDSNEIRFEDAKGKEELYIHAQKDRTEVVENDARRTVGNDCRTEVGHDGFDLVARNCHAITGGEKREAVGGNFSLTVGGDGVIAVAGQSDDLSVGGKFAIAARNEIHLKAPKIVIEADNISIRTTESGREFIHLEKGSGITIDSKGDKVWINTGGAGSPEDGCFKEPVLQPEQPFPSSDDPNTYTDDECHLKN